MTFVLLPYRSCRHQTWRNTRDAAAPSSFEVRSVHRPLPPSFPSLALSSCTSPVPMEYPNDRVHMSPHAGELWLVSLNDGEATLPIQLLVERRQITQDLCDRFRALVRGKAMPPSQEVLPGPRLVDY